MVLSSIISAMVSVERLATFLSSPELQPDARTILPPPPPTTTPPSPISSSPTSPTRDIDSKTTIEQGDAVLSVRKGEFRWSEKSVEPTLEGIDLDVRMGELLGVFGRVGCGKVNVPLILLLSNIEAQFSRRRVGRFCRRACSRPSSAR